MSMEETHDLAIAVITGQDIQLDICYPEKFPTLIAKVISATLHCNHPRGEFTGSVNYIIDGEEYVKSETFYSMWVRGWKPKEYV